LVKDSADCRQSHENGWLDKVNNFRECLELLAIIVIAGKVDLMLSELVSTVVCDETLRV
jgi:hypothetical protein